MLNHALTYASFGWAVFPVHSIQNGACTCGDPMCKRPGKHPITRNGFHNATTDPAQIQAWWTEMPWANIGISTGRPSGNLLVIDIDTKMHDGLTGEESWDDVNCGYPDTAEAVSGSGGRHIYFRYPDHIQLQSGQHRLGSSVDIRADNGYIIAPPSLHHSGGEYGWYLESDPTEGVPIAFAPDWLIELCLVRSIAPTTSIAETLLPPDKIKEIRSALCFINSDTREVWLQVGMALHSARSGEQGYGLWTEWSQGSDKFNPRDQRYTWDHMKADGGVTLSTLFALAKANGWVEPDNFQAVYAPVQIARQFNPETTFDGLDQPPGIMRDIVQYTLETAPVPQPMFAVNAALALCSVLLGRRVCGETGLRTNLYLLSVGKTTAGKDHPRKVIKNILHAAGLAELNGGESIASGQGLLTRVKKTPAVVFQLDEFGLLMQALQQKNAGRHNSEILSNLMKLFSSADSVMQGTEYADQKNRPRNDIEFPCVTVHATSTPETLYEAFSSGHVVSGYLNRFIVVDRSHDKKPPHSYPGPIPDPPPAILDWVRAVREMKSPDGNLGGVNPAMPIVIKRTPDARALFSAYTAEVDEQIENREAVVGSLWGRAWELADKIATIVACAENIANPVVTYDQALWSIRYVNYHLEQLASEVQMRVADSDFEKWSNEFYTAIFESRERGLTASEMGRKRPFRKHPPRMRQQILDSLQSSGQISKVNIATKGRNREAWIACEICEDMQEVAGSYGVK